jgi:hypothetical protein
MKWKRLYKVQFAESWVALLMLGAPVQVGWRSPLYTVSVNR